MKAFLEEYGLVIVVVIVLAVLIALAIYVSEDGKQSVKDTYNTFTEKADGIVDDMMKENVSSPSNGENSPTTGP